MRQGSDIARVTLRQRRTRRRNQSIRRRKRFGRGKENGQAGRVGAIQLRVGQVVATDVAQAGRQVTGLPIPPELVEPGVVEVEDGVSRAGDSVGHLAADASVAADVRGQLDTRPEIDVMLLFHARVNVGLARRDAHGVVDDAMDTALGVGDAVPRAEAVFVVNKGAIRDAPVGAATITTEAGNRVQNN